MAWIESHQDLATNPKAKRAARMLDVPLPQVVGHLHMLWWWALDHAFDGDLSSFDALDIADACGWDGDPDTFVKVLIGCGPGDKDGFLEPEWTIHDWDEFTRHLRARREASAKANHQRWHVDRDEPDTDCPYCVPSDSDESPNGERSEGVADSTEPDRTVPTEPDHKTSTSPPDGGDPDVSDDARRLTRKLALAVRANGFPIPSEGQKARNDWLIEMDRLLRLGPKGADGDPELVPDVETVERVIEFATTDEFWRPNIQSAPTFREKFPTLRLKANPNGARGSPRQETFCDECPGDRTHTVDCKKYEPPDTSHADLGTEETV